MIEIKNINLIRDRLLIKNGHICIPYGKLTGIVGKSGVGKTTLLEVIGLLSNDVFDYQFDGMEISCLSEEEKNELRRCDITFIFQDIHLFEKLNLKENIEFYAHLSEKQISDEDIYEYMNKMNLDLDIYSDVRTLSGGERQRLAVICGLVKDAKLFIFDEPTAYLDLDNKKMMMKMMKSLAYDFHKAVVISTHESLIIDELDIMYEINHQKLLLKRNDNYHEQSFPRSQKHFSNHLLYQYIQIINQKKKILHVFISLLLGVLMTLTSFSFVFSYQFQKDFQDNLQYHLHHELKIVKKDKTTISPLEFGQLKSSLSAPLYPYYEISGQIKYQNKIIENVSIAPYYPHQQLNQYLQYDFQSSDTYISYELYRKINQENIQIDFEIGDYQETYITSQILKPSFSSEYCIYVPFNHFQKILKEFDMSIYNVPLEYSLLALDDNADILSLIHEIDNQYVIPSLLDIEMKLNTLNIFNPQIILWINISIMSIFIIYQIYQVLQSKTDLALLKTLGIENQSLIKMKLYENKNIYITTSIIIILLSLLLSFIFDLSFIYIFILSIIQIVFIIIFFFIIYLYMLYRYTPSLLLRNE